MSKLQQVIRHPAGRIGITMGLAAGFVAAIMGEASKGLLLVGLCRFVASRIPRR